MTILIAYGTIEGQTGKIAHHIENLLQDSGNEVVLVDTSQSESVSFEGVDRVILAASVHERRHPKDFEVFLTAHEEDLAASKTLMLSVSLKAAFPEGREEAQDYIDEMKLRTGLAPDSEMLVAGAVRSATYDYYAAQVLRHVVLRDQAYDPSMQDYEFTDWVAIDDQVRAFLAA